MLYARLCMGETPKTLQLSVLAKFRMIAAAIAFTDLILVGAIAAFSEPAATNKTNTFFPHSLCSESVIFPFD